MSRSIFVALLALLPATAWAKGEVPFGDPWRSDVYSQTPSWVSTEVFAGVSTRPLDPTVATSTTGTGSSYGVRGLFHWDHRVSFPLELEWRNYRASAGSLVAGWLSYESSTFMIGTGLRYAPLTIEHFEFALSGRFGLHSTSSNAISAVNNAGFSWTSDVGYIGGGAEVVFYPLHSLGIGLGYSQDFILESEGVLASGAASFRLGWHF